MCLFVLGCCGDEEKALGSNRAPGNCPRCGGAVTATDVENTSRLCFLPVCLRNTTKYSCARCSCRLLRII